MADASESKAGADEPAAAAAASELVPPFEVSSAGEQDHEAMLAGAAMAARDTSPTQARARAQHRDQRASHEAEADALATLWSVIYASTVAWDRRLRRVHDLLAALGLANFIVVLLLYQVCWDSRSLRFDLEADECEAYVPLQIVGTVLYAAFMVVLLWFYYEQSGFKALMSHFPSRWSAFRHGGLVYYFLLECFASVLQPFPLLFLLLDVSHSPYLVILSLLAKLYLAARVLRDHSEIFQQRMFLKRGTRFDTSFYKMDYLTIAKTYSYHYTVWVVALGCALNALFMAYLLHLCERELWLPTESHGGALPRRYDEMLNPAYVGGGEEGTEGRGSELLLRDSFGITYFQSPYVSLLNCMYFVGIVSTTTGLGDIAPVTNQGKVFAVVAALMGIGWSSFVVGVFTNKLVPSDFQAYCIDYLQRSKIERQKHTLAATLIQRAWRLHRSWSKLQARGGRVPTDRPTAFMEELGPLIHEFQSVQRAEANQAFMVSALREGTTGTAAGATVRKVNQAVDVERARGNAMLQRGATPGSRTPSPSSSSITSPLVRHKQMSYGAVGGSSPRSAGRYSFPDIVLMQPGVQRSRSSSAVLSQQNQPRRRPSTEMSAEHALRALHNLNKPRGSGGQQHYASGTGVGGGGGGEELTAASVGGSPRHGNLASLRAGGIGSSIGGGGGGGYSSTSSALASLSAQNASLAHSLRSMEVKLEQLLLLASRPPVNIHENMLEGGHVFTSWVSNGQAGVHEDAVPQQMLLWHERDETKYGSLHWTTEEFAVHARLRIKRAPVTPTAATATATPASAAGSGAGGAPPSGSPLSPRSPVNSFPLHSITDVHLGKLDPVFSLPATSALPAALCFSVMSKSFPQGLKLQAQFAEERTRWISQLKQAFLPAGGRRSSSSGGGLSATSPRSAGPLSASRTSALEAHASRRASESLQPPGLPSGAAASTSMHSRNSSATSSTGGSGRHEVPLTGSFSSQLPPAAPRPDA